MRRMSLFFVGLGLSALAFGQSAPRVEISPTIGYLFGGRSLGSDRGPDSLGRRPPRLRPPGRVARVAALGVRVRLDPRSHPARVFVDAIPSISLDIDYLTPRVAYHFTTGALRPYIAGGLGVGLFDTADFRLEGLFHDHACHRPQGVSHAGARSAHRGSGVRVRRRRPAARFPVHRVRIRATAARRARLLRAPMDPDRRPDGRDRRRVLGASLRPAPPARCRACGESPPLWTPFRRIART